MLCIDIIKGRGSTPDIFLDNIQSRSLSDKELSHRLPKANN